MRSIKFYQRRAFLVKAATLPFIISSLGGLGGCAAPSKSSVEIEAGRRVRFEDTPAGARAILDESILFESGKYELLASADVVLDVLRPVFMKARGRILIEGHTDRDGSEVLNKKLSLSRALAVKEAMVKRQFSPERIDTVGLWWSVPRVEEKTAQDKKINRRAEFLFPGETVSSLGAVDVSQQAESELDKLGRLVGDFWGGMKRSVGGG